MFKITLSGTYHIIYTDLSVKSSQFIIHDDTKGNDLFVINIDASSNHTITINAVIPINTNNGYNHVEIELYMKSVRSGRSPPLPPFLKGARYSTFYIKYVHA